MHLSVVSGANICREFCFLCRSIDCRVRALVPPWCFVYANFQRRGGAVTQRKEAVIHFTLSLMSPKSIFPGENFAVRAIFFFFGGTTRVCWIFRGGLEISPIFTRVQRDANRQTLTAKTEQRAFFNQKDRPRLMRACVCLCMHACMCKAGP